MEHILSECSLGTKLYGGYKPNPAATDAFCTMLADMGHEPEGHKIAAANFTDEQKEVILSLFLFKAFPDWKSGRQGTGDCVSWACSHAGDTEGAVQAFLLNYSGPPQWLIASEAMYGFMRVNVNGRKNYGGPGSCGSDAADAVMKFGTLHRKAYNDGFDFTKYSGSKADQLGRDGVPTSLLAAAAEHKIVTATQVKDFKTAAQFIMNGYAIENADGSNPTCESSRDKDGYGRGRGYGHSMNYVGVRWGARPALLKANTGWSGTVSGPMYPDNMPETFNSCSWWEDASTCDKVLRTGDSFAYSKYEGWKAQSLPDWGTASFL